jgi:PadR family transcriptional regulator, regulatory protein PadR
MPTVRANTASPPSDLGLLQGTLDVMILKALSWGPMHGFGVAKWVRLTTDDVLQIEDGALYPALHRMEHRGLIEADWDLTENKRRAKYYRLTTKGRQQLRARASSWDRYSTAVSKVIHATVQPSAS